MWRFQKKSVCGSSAKLSQVPGGYFLELLSCSWARVSISTYCCAVLDMSTKSFPRTSLNHRNILSAFVRLSCQLQYCGIERLFVCTRPLAVCWAGGSVTVQPVARGRRWHQEHRTDRPPSPGCGGRHGQSPWALESGLDNGDF